MSRLATFVEMRKHPRAQLRLPLRIRWRGPLGMRLESAHTIDVAREGFLVHRTEPCVVGARVWVTFPFDPASAAAVQPETPARVLRVENAPGGSFRAALHLESQPRAMPHPPARERRAFNRIPFSLPIYVRAAGSPFPEESMTQDISRGGARFETTHIYAAGDSVVAQIPFGEWARDGEIPGRIIRIEAIEDSPGAAPLANPQIGTSAILTSVAVQWEGRAKT
jgi:hypothetical protein